MLMNFESIPETPTSGRKISPEGLGRSACNAHAKYLEALSPAMRHAWDIGQMLLQARGQMTRGQWRSWIKAECGLSLKQAKRFMEVATEGQALTMDRLEYTIKRR